MMRGRRGPGLVGTMARTAVIAGTATAVSGSVARHQQQKAYDQQQAQVAAAAPAPAPEPAPVAAAPAAGDPQMAQLQNLASLHSQGILTDEEFASAKAKLLGI